MNVDDATFVTSITTVSHARNDRQLHADPRQPVRRLLPGTHADVHRAFPNAARRPPCYGHDQIFTFVVARLREQRDRSRRNSGRRRGPRERPVLERRLVRARLRHHRRLPHGHRPLLELLGLERVHPGRFADRLRRRGRAHRRRASPTAPVDVPAVLRIRPGRSPSPGSRLRRRRTGRPDTQLGATVVDATLGSEHATARRAKRCGSGRISSASANQFCPTARTTGT